MKRTVVLPVSQAKEGRKTSALEKSLIRFFERELDVKLTRHISRRVSLTSSSRSMLSSLAVKCGEIFLFSPDLLLFSKRTPIFAMLNILRRRRCSPTLPLAFFMPIG